MNNFQPNSNYDLEERTAVFGERVISFLKKINQNIMTQSIIRQLIRSATSVGANYCEANEASSKKDFIHKISIAKKEVHETRYWLRIISHTSPSSTTEARILWKEAQELNLIFSKIVRSARKNN